MNRDEIKDALPDWVAGRLEPEQADTVGHAVELDDELRAEAELVRTISEGREAVPPDLPNEIMAAVARDRRGISRPGTSRMSVRRAAPAWAVGVAAVLALALGTMTILDPSSSGGGSSENADALAAVLDDGYSPWVADDGTVAGAPLLDGLSEEDLASLLEELGG
jgi:hypothetical protein